MEKFIILVLLCIFYLKEKGLLRGEVDLCNKVGESMIWHSISVLIGQLLELLGVILELLSYKPATLAVCMFRV